MLWGLRDPVRRTREISAAVGVIFFLKKGLGLKLKIILKND
jgi:hypothetical protein